MISLNEIIEKWQSTGVGIAQKMDAVYEYRQFADFFGSKAKNAMCFDMGQMERTVGLNFNLPAIQLPYPVCWFEGEITRDKGAVRRAALCIDDPFPWECSDGINSPKNMPTFYFLKNSGQPWIALGYGFMVIEDGGMRFVTDDRTQGALRNEMRCISTDVCVFLSLLNCTNIKKKKVEFPEKMQKKRAKKGKPPLFSYWTLHIDLEKDKEVTDENAGGSHASPRVHLRRGHIREYSPGHFTWVQPCVVGNNKKGMVHKDYMSVSAITKIGDES